MEIFIIILGLVWSILTIILFFKLWKMTNNVDEIRELLENYCIKEKTETPKRDKPSTTKFTEGQLVVELKTERQYRVQQMGVDANQQARYFCINSQEEHWFSENEILDHSEWCRQMGYK
ncbi:MAG: hypothetical protein IJW42_04430 [Alistipes sp.]|nr:hypothetical protein [Alistipes sp.]